ncbi:GNAT family N-acetyltransferase [Prosthecobacter sp. SYSU 5D2]|uniref:GNAT family N-acetyltransferase n=1 Tax=Prosthecobacter sp. SYSU 5D2 TaxID=3134134 RepID=UPI0031FED9E4
MLRLENVQGQEIEPHLDALGALRITVFRDFPYLYDGSLEYERDYLKAYVECPRSLVVLAFHGDAAVGATTCMPLADEAPAFKEAFIKAGLDLSKVCYFGESILLLQYRGRGMGKQFFKHRENHARSLGLTLAAFCAVDRAEDHPLRPLNYHPLDDFWSAQGYRKQPDMQATLSWKEVGEDAESPKKLTFWTKELG